MRSGESIFQYVTYFYFHCVLFFLVKFPSALDFAPHSAKELSFVVPAVLLLLLVVVAVASAVPDTGAQSRKPFYVYFRILHAYTTIYLKYRVY